MIDRRSEPVEWRIAHNFARWTVPSALSRAPVRDHKKIRAALDVVSFDPLFDTGMGAIDRREFDDWHAEQVSELINHESQLTYGWAAKIIAVYLKTTCYLAGFGREGLRDVIHPPIDRELMKALRRNPWKNSQIKPLLPREPNITAIDETAYLKIMIAFTLISAEEKCRLFEVEQFWQL